MLSAASHKSAFNVTTIKDDKDQIGSNNVNDSSVFLTTDLRTNIDDKGSRKVSPNNIDATSPKILQAKASVAQLVYTNPPYVPQSSLARTRHQRIKSTTIEPKSVGLAMTPKHSQHAK